MKIVCIRCGKTPEELPEYVAFGIQEGMSAEEYVIAEEGTFNPANGHFLCDADYIAEGMPSLPGGWVAP